MDYAGKNNIFRNMVLAKFGLTRKIVRAEGHYLYDSAGNKIADNCSQYGALPFGHSSEIYDKVSEYLQKKGPIFVQPFNPETTEKLSIRLCDLAGPDYSFVVFSNSGAETVESAIKLAKFKTKRRKVLSTYNSFHGKTSAALSATGSERFSSETTVDSLNYDKIDFNDLEALRQRISSQEYAAFIVEPIQGEGGMVEATNEFLTTAQTLCKKHKTMFLLDEVQTGIGRTGYVIAAQKYQIQPDMILLSKALGGGVYPIGAVIVKDSAYCCEFDEKHSSTFANGGLASHIANCVLDKLEDESNVLQGVREKELYITSKLNELGTSYRNCFSYSGAGLMYALRFNDAITYNNAALNFFKKQGVLAALISGYLLFEKDILSMPFLGPASNAIRFEPPLDVAYEQIDIFFDAIEEICKIISLRRYDVLLSFVISRDISAKERETALRVQANEPTLEVYENRYDVPRFAFLIHTTSEQNLADALPQSIRQHYTSEEKLRLANWMVELGRLYPDPHTVANVVVRSKQGGIVNGVLIFSPLTAVDMMKLPRQDKARLMELYFHIAHEEKVDIVGLGAFTSVISRSGTDLDTSKINITTGNSFTALSTAEAIKHRMSPNINSKNLMVIGARGSVGRLLFLELAGYFKNVIVVGSKYSGVDALRTLVAECVLEHLIEADIQFKAGSALDRFMEIADLNHAGCKASIELLKENGIAGISFLEKLARDNDKEFPFSITTNIDEYTSVTDCVVSATSEGKPFIKGDVFRPGTIIFDAARPFDIDLSTCTDIEVYEGGLVSQPSPAMFGDSNMVGTPAGINLACLSETIALAMEGVDKSYSLGKKIPYIEAKEVFDIATKHGFKFHVKPKTDVIDTHKLKLSNA